MKTTALYALACLCLCGASKTREWKIGLVLDSRTSQASYVTGAVTNTSGTATATGTATTAGSTTTGVATASGHSTSTTTVQRVTVRENELLIQGEGYVFVIQDVRRRGGPLLATALANRHHGCRFIVGENVKYAQEKGDLFVLDPDGKECKVQILRQQKRETQPKESQ